MDTGSGRAPRRHSSPAPCRRGPPRRGSVRGRARPPGRLGRGRPHGRPPGDRRRHVLVSAPRDRVALAPRTAHLGAGHRGGGEGGRCERYGGRGRGGGRSRAVGAVVDRAAGARAGPPGRRPGRGARSAAPRSSRHPPAGRRGGCCSERGPGHRPERRFAASPMRATPEPAALEIGRLAGRVRRLVGDSPGREPAVVRADILADRLRTLATNPPGPILVLTNTRLQQRIGDPGARRVEDPNPRTGDRAAAPDRTRPGRDRPRARRDHGTRIGPPSSPTRGSCPSPCSAGGAARRIRRRRPPISSARGFAWPRRCPSTSTAWTWRPRSLSGSRSRRPRSSGRSFASFPASTASWRPSDPERSFSPTRRSRPRGCRSRALARSRSSPCSTG